MSKEASGSIAQRETEKVKWIKLFWEIIKGTVIGVAAVFSFLANQNSERTKADIEQARVAIEQKTAQSQLDIKAYEFVERTLSLAPTDRNLHGSAAAAIVNSLTQEPLRGALQNALFAVLTDPKVREQLKNSLEFDMNNTWPNSSGGVQSTQKQSTLPS
jgi:hypothetical protein